MKIGIDIDDTITNSSDVFIEYAKKYNEENNIHYDIDNTTLDTKKSFGWEMKNQIEFSNKYLKGILQKVNSKLDSIEVINKLKKEGHKIYFITARSDKEIEGSMFELTENWLRSNDYEYDLLITESKDKLSDCIKHNIDLFIDDSYSNCKSIKDKMNIPVLLFTTRYNSNIKDDSLIRVNNWFDIYNFLKGGLKDDKKT